MNQWPESRNIDDFISFIAEIMQGYTAVIIFQNITQVISKSSDKEVKTFQLQNDSKY